MSELIMRRHADDNEYLHRDFHASIDNAVAYIGDTYGVHAVEQYLHQYVQSRYKPMTLNELADYFRDIYTAEHFDDKLHLSQKNGCLSVKIDACPGIAYFNSVNQKPSAWYPMTTSVLYRELACLCSLRFKLDSYNEITGAAEFSFTEVSE